MLWQVFRVIICFSIMATDGHKGYIYGATGVNTTAFAQQEVIEEARHLCIVLTKVLADEYKIESPYNLKNGPGK